MSFKKREIKIKNFITQLTVTRITTNSKFKNIPPELNLIGFDLYVHLEKLI